MPIASIRTGLTTALGLEGPLIQAPMAGGATTPELVAAVSNAGALGSLGGAYLQPAVLESAIRTIKALTGRPFGVNLFIPFDEPKFTREQFDAAVAATRRYREELGLPDPVLRAPFAPDFEEQLSIILKERPAVFSFTMGALAKERLEECRKRGMVTFGTATTLEDALSLQESGVDAIVAQGAEAGAHRGTFSAENEDRPIGLSDLLRALAGTVRIPIIAAGGIMNGRGIAAALRLGAQAAQLGTAFLACEESGISKAYRDALMDPDRRATRLTRAFSGRWARGLENRFIVEMSGREDAILPFPAQNGFTQDLRKRAADLELPEYLSLWAGEGIGLIRAMKADTLVRTLFKETLEAHGSGNAL